MPHERANTVFLRTMIYNFNDIYLIINFIKKKYKAMGNIVTQKELVEIIAKAWNALDAAIIEPLLADDFEYQSFWV